MNLETLKFPIGHFTKPDIITENDIKNWMEVIEFFPAKIKNISYNLSIEELNWKYRPDGWTIKQVIHHSADSHINSFIRFKLAITEDNPTIKPYEEAKWAELIDGNCDAISSSLLILEGVHKRWSMLLKSFGELEFSKAFMHPESKKIYSLDEALGLYAWHCNHHLAHIEQALFYKGKFN
jgi:DinB superfamily